MEEKIIYYSNNKKKCGYLYNNELNIFCKLDKYEIEKYEKERLIESEIIFDNIDLENEILDCRCPIGEIPIGLNLILNVITKEKRERKSSDGFTFFLDIPAKNTEIENTIKKITEDFSFLRNFLYKALSGTNSQEETLLIEGPCYQLFSLLDLIYPLFDKCDHKLLYKKDIAKNLIRNIKGKKLLFTELDDNKNLRRAKELGIIPLCIKCKNISSSHPDKIFKLKCNEIEIKIRHTQNEFLNWIIYG